MKEKGLNTWQPGLSGDCCFAWKAGGFELTLASPATRQFSLGSGPAGRPALVALVIEPYDLAVH